MRTVLVIDDEFGVAELLRFALEDEGYRVVTAVNGRQGVQRLAETPRPDVVLLDYMMPVLDGAGVLRAMQADESLARIPVVVMSSLDEATVREACRDFTAFLRKPFRIEAVVEAVARALSATPGGTGS